jgi:hypothetical protein
MYESIRFEGLRALDNVELEGLRRVNLIVGKNNVGKTTVLEGLLLLGGATNPAMLLTLGQMRGQRWDRKRPEPEPIWRSFGHAFQDDRAIQVRGHWRGEPNKRLLKITRNKAQTLDALGEDPTVARALNETRRNGVTFDYRGAAGEPLVTTMELENGGLRVRSDRHDQSASSAPGAFAFALPESARQTPPPRADLLYSRRFWWEGPPQLNLAPTTLVSARARPLEDMAEQYGKLLREKKDRPVLEALRLLDDRIQRLEVVHESGAPAIYCDLGFPALAPLAVCGDGVVRLFSFAVELTAVQGGVLLIDELDAGLHHSVMVPFWRTLRKLAEEHDVQIFATTHDDDLIRSAMSAFDDDLSWLCLHRLDRRKQGIVAVRYDEEALATARDERFEVRG